MIKIIIDGQYAQVSNALIWVTFAISLAVALAFYMLRSFGLYVMAKRKGLDKPYLAFIPCVWMFTACKLIGNVRTFGSTFKKLALAFTIIFSVGQVLNFVYQFLLYFPVVGNFLVGKELYLVMVTDASLIDAYVSPEWTQVSNSLYINEFSNPYLAMGISNRAVNVILTIINYVTLFTDLAIIVITISVYINLFRRYIPNHYILFSILSVLGIFAPLVFAVRKKAPVNYSDYLRSRYNMWYANGNPYGGQVNNGAPQAPSTPFEEFAEKGEIDPGDPFDNFDNNNSKKNDDNDDFFN